MSNLSSFVKRIRDVMRNDAGIAGVCSGRRYNFGKSIPFHGISESCFGIDRVGISPLK